MTSLLLTAALALALAVPMHWWPRLPATHRRRLSIATSLAGLGFLVAALRSEGLRESALTSLVLVGPGDAHRARLGLGEPLLLRAHRRLPAARLRGPRSSATRSPAGCRPRPLLSSVAVAWLVTVVRLLLEKSAAPSLLVEAVGVTWLAPVAGVYLALALRPEGVGPTALLQVLLRYAFLVRGFVALVGVVATRLAAGTHYDVSPLTEVPVAFAAGTWVFAPGSWEQLFWLTLLPQLVIWPAFTVLVGMAAARRGLRCCIPASEAAPSERRRPGRRRQRRLAAQRTRQLVSPRPEPQRLLPSEKFEHTNPPVQSLSLEQVSHSSPLLPQEPIGSASASSSPHALNRPVHRPRRRSGRRSCIASMCWPRRSLRGL